MKTLNMGTCEYWYSDIHLYIHIVIFRYSIMYSYTLTDTRVGLYLWWNG